MADGAELSFFLRATYRMVRVNSRTVQKLPPAVFVRTEAKKKGSQLQELL